MKRNKEVEQKTLAEILLPLVKSKSVTCSENKCDKCATRAYFGVCEAKEFANKIAKELVGLGYGNIKEFAELEDKLESGTLVELPCRLGQSLYTIDKRREFVTYGKISYIINEQYCAGEIVVCEDGEFRFYTPTQHPECLIFGKDIFTTRKQAEAKLKELTEKQ